MMHKSELARVKQNDKLLRQPHDALLNAQVDMFKVESKVIKQKQIIQELEQKVDLANEELNAFQTELRGFIEQQKAAERNASKFKQGVQSIYYDPTVLGHKNPTSSGHTVAVDVSPLSLQLDDHSRIHPADATVTTSKMASPVKHTTTQGNLSGRSADNMATTGISLPEKLKLSKEFAELQSCYSDIVTNMPENYLETVQLLESHLCNQHISEIFECSSALDANQTIVKCLIENTTCKSDVLDFCEDLLLLKNASQLVCIIENLRKNVIQSLLNSPNITESPASPAVTTNSTKGNENNSSTPEGGSKSQASNTMQQATELHHTEKSASNGDQVQDTDANNGATIQPEQAEAMSQAYMDIMNQMGMGPLLSAFSNTTTDNSQAHSAELVSQSAKLLQHIGPVMENMGDMLSTLDSSDEEQDQDTDDTSSDQSQQAANLMSQSMDLLKQTGMASWLSAFSNATEDSAGGDSSSDQSQQAANVMSQSMKLLNQMGMGSAAGNTSGDQMQQTSNLMSLSMEFLKMGMGSQPSASNVTEHSGSGNSEQQQSDIGGAIKQMGSVMKQMGPMFSAISEKVQSQLKDQPVSHSAKPISVQGLYMYTKDDQVAALASFDNYYDLLILMDPNPLEEKLVQLKFFPDGEQPLRSNQGAGSNMVHIERLLKKARIVIVHEGAAKFIKLVMIVSQEKPYDELAYHLVDCYISSGAHTIPRELKNLVTSLSRAELTRVIQEHQNH